MPWWDGPSTREAVAELLARDAAKPKGTCVWVYHSPTSRARRRSFGDADLNGWIDTYRPDIVLAGHIHQARFEGGGSWADRIGDTWIFNAGRQIGPMPTHGVLDLEARKAYWSSLMGGERVDLDAPLTRTIAKADAPDWLRA